MIYNMDYLLAALIFICILFGHYCSQKRLASVNSQVFFWLAVIGIADMILDLVTSVLIMNNDPALELLIRLTLTMFYMMQAAYPYLLMCYIHSLRDTDYKAVIRSMKGWAIPTLMMEALILANIFAEFMFGFDERGHYIKGPYWVLMYIYVLVYCLLVGEESIRRYKELGRKRFMIIWEVMIVSGSCVAMQAVNPSTLMTGLAIALGVLILFLNVNNPSDYTDTLTGVFARETFDQWVQEKMGGTESIYLLMVDVPGIRRINKYYGASMGDKILALIGGRAEEIQPEGLVFRVEGNTFILAGTSKAEHDKAETEMRQLLEHPIELGGNQYPCKCVICSFEQAQKMGSSDKMYACMEFLVSLEKEKDTENTVFIECDEKRIVEFWYQQEVERYLGEAIENDLFEVYYQPVFDVRSGKPVTMEALSRLEHPKFGKISPDLFIRTAEKNGTIMQVSKLQFRRICRFIKEHPELTEKIRNVKYNLSPTELMRPGYGKYLIDTIHEFGLENSFLEFEITETVATEYSENLRQAVKDILDAGIGLCLDDFGSGYANLNTVLKLPFSSIKLDRSLLNGICDDKMIADFYQNVSGALRNMGYSIVAEGVEKKEEVDLLRIWGIDMIQGYYYSRPLPENEILKLLEIG